MSRGFPGGSVVQNPPASAGDMGSISGSDNPLGKKITTHSSGLAWRIPWIQEPGGLQSMGLQESKTCLTSQITTKSG